jgi:hypothetical protein
MSCTYFDTAMHIGISGNEFVATRMQGVIATVPRDIRAFLTTHFIQS